jgi:NADPH-dependent 2,4-dienoyl-CoA reductase/sulfur reductase-like enzyme
VTVAIVGAGPAGTRAAEVLVRAGLRPAVIDEAAGNGGRIYQRQPDGFARDARALYGFEAAKARAVHESFAALADRIDWHPRTLVWSIRPDRLLTLRDGVQGEVPWRHLILATGAMDRIVPVPGWTLPGVFTLGGAQVALKTQGVAIGRRVAFVGTGPLLVLVACQYAKAGAEVVLVLDTAGFASAARQATGLARGGATFAKGLYYIATLRRRGVRVVRGGTPLAFEGDGELSGLRWRDARGEYHVACDAAGLGFGLKPETQLADLAEVPFTFDARQRLWLPERDATGRTPRPGIGADVAELAGARAAWAIIEDRGLAVDRAEVARLDRALARHAPFRAALDLAFPYPGALSAAVPDDSIVCRCEAVTAGELRAAARDAPEVNRGKALTRVGMGRCQGRVCGPPAAEILAAALGCDIAEVGRLRGQPPVKPIPVLA